MFAKVQPRITAYMLVAIAIGLLPLALPNPFYINLAQEVALLAIAGIGLNLLLGLSGQISLGQAGFFAVGAYASALLSQRGGWPIELSIPGATLIAGIFGLLLGLVALRARTHYLAMITLAFGFIVAILAQRWIGLTGGSMGLSGLPQMSWGDIDTSPRNYLWTVALLLLGLQVVCDFAMQSRTARVLRTIAESESFAATVGIRASFWRAGVFVLSAMLAGLAGALFAHQTGFISSDTMSLDRSLALLIVVVVGGLGHTYGPLLGGLFLVTMNQALADLYSYANYIFGSLLLLVMIFMPDGLSGLPGLLRRFRAAKSIPLSPVSPMPSGIISTVTPAPDGVELVLSGVTKSYDGVRAVQEVSFTVRSSSVHALIGPNGAGKSTLINVISGLYRADEGSIRMRGTDVTDWAAHRRARGGMARTFQNLQLIGGLTVLENVMLALPDERRPVRDFLRWLVGLPHESETRDRALAMLAIMGIDSLAHRHPGELSYGHRKLAELARALGQSPTLLLLDEPIAGLNEEESIRIAQSIRRLRDAGVTILLVEHDMGFVMSLADTVTVLDYGQVIANGTPDAVRRDPAVIEAYLGVEVKV